MTATLETMFQATDDAARTLRVRMVSRETSANHSRTTFEDKPPALQHHLVCDRCDQSVWCLSPDATGPGYVFVITSLLAQAGSHIRQCHEDMIPNT